MSAPEPEEQEKKWDDPYRPPKRPFRWVGSVLAVLFLYVLSVGPASALAARGTISTASMDRIYQPLDALADKSPWTKRLLYRYIGLWVSKTATTRSTR